MKDGEKVNRLFDIPGITNQGKNRTVFSCLTFYSTLTPLELARKISQNLRFLSLF